MSRSIRHPLVVAAVAALGLLAAAPAFAGRPDNGPGVVMDKPNPNQTDLNPGQQDVPQQQQQQQSSRSPEYTDNNLGVRGMLTGRGFLVTRVTEGGVMEKVGLEEGDVILSVDGRAVRSWDDWVATFSRQHGPNEPVALRIRDWRTGQTAFRYLSDL